LTGGVRPAGQLPKPSLRLQELGGVCQEPKAAWVPADRILRAQTEGRSDLALIDRVVRQRGEQQGVRIAGRRVAIDHQVPSAVSRGRGRNGQHAKYPTLPQSGFPFLSGADLSLEFHSLAGASRGGACLTDNNGKDK